MGRRARGATHRLAGADLPAHRAGARELSRRRLPERLPGLVDSHVHLQHSRFDGDRAAVIARAAAAGIERLLVPGWDVASSEAALELAAAHAGFIQAAVGVHPHDVGVMEEPAWARLEALARDARVSAIGEIGLDYFRNLSPPEAQREALERQLFLAALHDLPVLVHDREAHDDVAGALLRWSGRERHRVRGVLHAFSGDWPMAKQLHARGFLVSFALPVAFRSASGPREAARLLPDGSFLVETDAPYLGPAADHRNEPTTALRVTAELARLRGSDPATLVSPIRSAYEAMTMSDRRPSA